MGKIPGLASNLPEKYGTLGKPLETYQDGGNNIGNVLLNPAFVNRYNPSKEVQMVTDIYNQTGDAKQVPRVVDKKITVSGISFGKKVSKTFELTGEEFTEYQKLVGEKTQQGFSKVPSTLKPEAQSKRMQDIMNQANQEAKIVMLKKRGVRAIKDGVGIKVLGGL